jgi:mannitol/fructose-specific phosphotransferase system IIA component
MPVCLHPDQVLLGRRCSKEEAIRAIGEVMVRRGDVTPRYVAGMLEKERQFNTCITDGVALPHGTAAVRCEVLRDSVVFVQFPDGTDWGGGKTVYLALGFAGTGDQQHLDLLASIAAILQQPEKVAKLRAARNEQEVISILASVSA